jgi:ATP-dependent phosphoenolpyruvate carboxykinase
MAKTGRFTGRSPRDKYIVQNPGSESEKLVDWGKINQPISLEVYKELYEKAVQYFNTKDKIYVFDGFCGAGPKTQKRFALHMSLRGSNILSPICLSDQLRNKNWTT